MSWCATARNHSEEFEGARDHAEPVKWSVNVCVNFIIIKERGENPLLALFLHKSSFPAQKRASMAGAAGCRLYEDYVAISHQFIEINI